MVAYIFALFHNEAIFLANVDSRNEKPKWSDSDKCSLNELSCCKMPRAMFRVVGVLLALTKSLNVVLTYTAE